MLWGNTPTGIAVTKRGGSSSNTCTVFDLSVATKMSGLSARVARAWGPSGSAGLARKGVALGANGVGVSSVVAVGVPVGVAVGGTVAEGSGVADGVGDSKASS